ncbi:8-amino-7-oxononanoate synthase [Volucribacter psittacicida]|uniref:8-amino-7-oxononanoate synthase n=1 Tax=Volucribacter psittacicida TaxID=203482 RepID=A0A4R1FX67_9PAST|nr:8-amino-7-oxononanoate synthase [Volucribacter psittacicida]TCJ98342.1 8-amino-7-oxononanoate synthase [Volucribacter psittacicida]
MVSLQYFADNLTQLKQQQQLRQLPDIEHKGKYIRKDQQTMLNLTANDYLGLANDEQLVAQFWQQVKQQDFPFTSSSSRLLTGNYAIYHQLEQLIAQRFQRESCLLFNSGYHANIGILPALANKHTLILADKLVHASMIDGIRLSQGDFIRYRHNDMAHLLQLLNKHHQQYQRIIIVTESIFSMDGDITPLSTLVKYKKQFDNVMLYVDEAHAIGAYGEQGLGMAEVFDCIQDIDLLIGTFGKALASMGAYVVCDEILREYLINHMRSLIFATALPPINMAWSYFIFQRLPLWQDKRQHLAEISAYLRDIIQQKTGIMPSQTAIIPYILGKNELAQHKAKQLQQAGFYCLPIRPPTVPINTARIRFSLSADISLQELQQLTQYL